MAEENMNRDLFSDREAVDVDLDIRTEIHFSRKDHPQGKMIPVSVDGKEEYVLIPLDVKDGDIIKVCGRGKHNSRLGKTGDLYIGVHIEVKTVPWKKIFVPVVLIAVAAIGFFIFQRTEEPEFEACTHSWISANCTTPKTCNKCGEVIGDALGHKWIAATCTTPKTCEVCGLETGVAKEHQWVDATYFSPKTCSVCQLTEGEALQNPLVEPIREYLPIVTYAMTSKEKVYGYEDPDLKEQSTEFYFAPGKDEIVITNISENALAVEICYPSSITASGYRTLWFATKDILPLSEILIDNETADERKNTFRYSENGSSVIRYGSMDGGNRYTIFGSLESGYKVIVYSIYKQTIFDIDVRHKIALIQ